MTFQNSCATYTSGIRFRVSRCCWTGLSKLDGGRIGSSSPVELPALDGRDPGSWPSLGCCACCPRSCPTRYGGSDRDRVAARAGGVGGRDRGRTACGRLRLTRQREELSSFRLIDVSHLCLYGNVQTTAQALRVLLGRGVLVLRFSYGGWLLGVSSGFPSRNVTLRIHQVGAATRGEIDVPKLLVAGKIRNQRVLLRHNARGDVTRTLVEYPPN